MEGPYPTTALCGKNYGELRSMCAAAQLQRTGKKNALIMRLLNSRGRKEGHKLINRSSAEITALCQYYNIDVLECLRNELLNYATAYTCDLPPASSDYFVLWTDKGMKGTSDMALAFRVALEQGTKVTAFRNKDSAWRAYAKQAETESRREGAASTRGLHRHTAIEKAVHFTELLDSDCL